MVDARGGIISCSRHPGFRFIFPPKSVSEPTRLIYGMVPFQSLPRRNLPRPKNLPILEDGEGFANRFMYINSSAHLKGPILVEVPHYASLRGTEREIYIQSSETGESWITHQPATNLDTLLQKIEHIHGSILF